MSRTTRSKLFNGHCGDRERREPPKLIITAEDSDNILDRKKALPSGKLHGWGSYGCVNYKYIRRLFAANVNQPYDEVYRNLCKFADTRSWAGYEWRHAINNELIHPSPCEEIEDGLYTLDGHRVCWCGNPMRSIFYIDASGILRDYKPATNRINRSHSFMKGHWESNNSVSADSFKVSATSFLISSKCIWYIVDTMDISALTGDYTKLIDATAGAQKDVLLYTTAWKELYREKPHSYRWEAVIRSTYCGELRVGLSKRPAPTDILRLYGKTHKKPVAKYSDDLLSLFDIKE